MDLHDLATDETGSATANMEDLTPMTTGTVNQSNDSPEVSHLDRNV
jgi:hypothetical protein